LKERSDRFILLDERCETGRIHPEHFMRVLGEDSRASIFQLGSDAADRLTWIPEVLVRA
jgi:hypothetical protein